MMRIAIASGKGGTGKTIVATNLAWTGSRVRPRRSEKILADDPAGRLSWGQNLCHPGICSI